MAAPVRNAFRTMDDIPAETDISRAMSRDLKRRGFKFVGPTICYAFMQAAGLVNDHLVTCFRYRRGLTRPPTNYQLYALTTRAFEPAASHGGGALAMTTEPLFKAANPYQDDVLALPVEDLDQASQWYANALGLTEVERRDDPVPTVIMQRDGVQIGFAINGGGRQQRRRCHPRHRHRARPPRTRSQRPVTRRIAHRRPRRPKDERLLPHRPRRPLLLLPPTRRLEGPGPCGLGGSGHA